MNAQMDIDAIEMPGAQILWGVIAAPVTRDTQEVDFIAMMLMSVSVTLTNATARLLAPTL